MADKFSTASPLSFRKGTTVQSKQELKDINIFQKAGHPLNDRIKDMQESGQQGGEYANARRKSIAHLMGKTDQMYHRKDHTRIKMDEFSVDFEFKYGVPMIILDVINAFTGFNIIEIFQENQDTSDQQIQRMDPED